MAKKQYALIAKRRVYFDEMAMDPPFSRFVVEQWGTKAKMLDKAAGYPSRYEAQVVRRSAVPAILALLNE